MSDVTDRILAERARAHLAALVASSQDAIVTLSVAGVITTWNRGAEGMLGVAAADAIGGDARQLIPDGHLAFTRAMFADCVAGVATRPCEMQLLRSDGATIEVSLAMSLIVADDGEVLGVSVLSRDISAQKRADEQNRVRQRELERANAILKSASVFLAAEFYRPQRIMVDASISTGVVGTAPICNGLDIRRRRIRQPPLPRKLRNDSISVAMVAIWQANCKSAAPEVVEGNASR